MKTKSKRNLLALGGVAAASLLAGLLISSKLDWTNPTAAAPEQESANLGGADVPGSSLLAKIAREDTPSVVNISTTKILRGRRPFGSRRRPSPFDEFFGQDDVWERFFGEQPERDLKQHSLGSGFIIDEKGYISSHSWRKGVKRFRW